MTAVMTYQFEDSALDQLVTALCVAPVQMGVALVWLVTMTAKRFADAIQENWRHIAALAAIVTVPIALALMPQVAIGLAMITIYAKVTRPCRKKA